MNKTRFTHKVVRRMIANSLPTDSEFEAFCIDHYMCVKCRFTNGMDRLQKVNLLLECVEIDDLAEKLQTPPAYSLLGLRERRTASLGIIGGLTLLLMSIVAWQYFTPTQLHGWRPAASRLAHTAASARWPERSDEPNVSSQLDRGRAGPLQLVTTPPGATVFDIASGRRLGTTPFLLPSTTEIRLCLRLIGFQEQMVHWESPPSADLRYTLLPYTATVTEKASLPCQGPVPLLN